MPTGTLPGEGKALFEEVYQKALKGSCKGDKECAARTAWSAVKGAGWHKDKDGEWVKSKSDIYREFSMAVAKVSFDKATQERHITLVASDTDPDLADEKMSVHLFQDFVNRIESQQEVPEPFRSAICEQGWCGGQPYLSISHYKSAGGKNVPGEVRTSYVDGNRFKSKAVLHDTVLGKAVFQSLNDDLTGKSKFDDKVRVSIGFLDLAHKHGDFLFERKSLTDVCPRCADGAGDKEYWEGVLVHEAFTRKPMNPRTDVEVQKMAILTKKDDAQSIVGDAISELDLEAKSQITEEELIVIRSIDMIEHVRNVLNGFYDSFSKPPEPVNPSPYVHSVMKDHVIASVDGKMYKIGYEMDDEMKPKFAKSDDWQEMMMGFMPVKKSEDEAIIWMAATKSEGDCNHPSSHYLVVEDTEKPTTWHLRYRNCDGKIDTRLLGAAKAALTVGYRGNKYEGPNKAEALAKLKRLYKSAGLEWKADLEEPMPEDIVEDVVEETPVEPKVEEPKVEEAPAAVEVAPVVAETAVDRAIAAFRSKILDVKSRGAVGDAALTELQPAFNELGNVVKSEFMPQLDPTLAGIAEIVRSAIAQEVAPVMASLQAEISELKSRAGIAAAQRQDVTVARSLTVRPELPVRPAVSSPASPYSKIAALAYKSTEPR